MYTYESKEDKRIQLEAQFKPRFQADGGRSKSVTIPLNQNYLHISSSGFGFVFGLAARFLVDTYFRVFYFSFNIFDTFSGYYLRRVNSSELCHP